FWRYHIKKEVAIDFQSSYFDRLYTAVTYIRDRDPKFQPLGWPVR
uniref:Uncharacterized protein n=1 Tax=Triticum urartu TaxID=4572 RepID=A0A8R7QEH3_TRIUA